MTSQLAVLVFLLGLSAVSPLDFTTVYEWGANELDLDWPSEDAKEEAIADNVFKPEAVEPLSMAVYKDKIYLALAVQYDVPMLVTLVTLPTSSNASTPPRLAPYPSWESQSKENCFVLNEARAIEVDNEGLLWVADMGNVYCHAKILIYDLEVETRSDKDLLYEFPESVIGKNSDIKGIALDKSADDTVAYITDLSSKSIVGFSLKAKDSWTIKTKANDGIVSIAVSPKKGGSDLFLGPHYSTDVYSVSLSSLTADGKKASLKEIGEWDGASQSYRYLIDEAGLLYAVFYGRKRISAFNTSAPFKETFVYETKNADSWRPFTFALDEAGTLWVTERNSNNDKPKHKLLKASVGARSYLYHDSPALAVSTTPKAPEEATTTPAVSVAPPTTSTTTPSPELKSSEKDSDSAGVVAEKSPASSPVSINILICLVQPCNFAAGAEPGQVQVSGNQELKNRNITIIVN